MDAGPINRLAIIQRKMVRELWRLKRHHIMVGDVKLVTEEWLTLQARSFRKANAEINARAMDMGTLLRNEKRFWAGRVARFGPSNKPRHVSKF